MSPSDYRPIALLASVSESTAIRASNYLNTHSGHRSWSQSICFASTAVCPPPIRPLPVPFPGKPVAGPSYIRFRGWTPPQPPFGPCCLPREPFPTQPLPLVECSHVIPPPYDCTSEGNRLGLGSVSKNTNGTPMPVGGCEGLWQY